LIELAKIIIFLRTFRSMEIFEWIMSAEHELHVALPGFDRFSPQFHGQYSLCPEPAILV
jgi:hypothetical protein